MKKILIGLFVLGSVSFGNGQKYDDTKMDIEAFRYNNKLVEPQVNFVCDKCHSGYLFVKGNKSFLIYNIDNTTEHMCETVIGTNEKTSFISVNLASMIIKVNLNTTGASNEFIDTTTYKSIKAPMKAKEAFETLTDVTSNVFEKYKLCTSKLCKSYDKQDTYKSTAKNNLTE